MRPVWRVEIERAEFGCKGDRVSGDAITRWIVYPIVPRFRLAEISPRQIKPHCARPPKPKLEFVTASVIDIIVNITVFQAFGRIGFREDYRPGRQPRLSKSDSIGYFGRR